MGRVYCRLILGSERRGKGRCSYPDVSRRVDRLDPLQPDAPPAQPEAVPTMNQCYRRLEKGDQRRTIVGGGPQADRMSLDARVYARHPPVGRDVIVLVPRGLNRSSSVATEPLCSNGPRRVSHQVGGATVPADARPVEIAAGACGSSRCSRRRTPRLASSAICICAAGPRSARAGPSAAGPGRLGRVTSWGPCRPGARPGRPGRRVHDRVLGMKARPPRRPGNGAPNRARSRCRVSEENFVISLADFLRLWNFLSGSLIRLWHSWLAEDRANRSRRRRHCFDRIHVACRAVPVASFSARLHPSSEAIGAR